MYTVCIVAISTITIKRLFKPGTPGFLELLLSGKLVCMCVCMCVCVYVHVSLLECVCVSILMLLEPNDTMWSDVDSIQIILVKRGLQLMLVR